MIECLVSALLYLIIGQFVFIKYLYKFSITKNEKIDRVKFLLFHQMMKEFKLRDSQEVFVLRFALAAAYLSISILWLPLEVFIYKNKPKKNNGYHNFD